MNLFWPLLLSLFCWAVIAVFVWAPWWVTLFLSLLGGLVVLLGLLEHARSPVIVRGGEQ